MTLIVYPLRASTLSAERSWIGRYRIGAVVTYPPGSASLDDVLRIVHGIGMGAQAGRARDSARVLIADLPPVLGAVDTTQRPGIAYGDTGPALTDSCRDTRGRCNGSCKTKPWLTTRSSSLPTSRRLTVVR